MSPCTTCSSCSTSSSCSSFSLWCHLWALCVCVVACVVGFVKKQLRVRSLWPPAAWHPNISLWVPPDAYIYDDNSRQISINLDQIHCSRAEEINFLTKNLSLIVECIHFHKNIHPNITKRRSYSAEISRHPRLHTSLNAPTIPILLGLSTWREKKYPYKDGEHELWTVLWPYEFLLTRVPLHYGIRQVMTISWADMWSDFVLVYNLSKTTFVKFCVGFFAYRKFKCV